MSKKIHVYFWVLVVMPENTEISEFSIVGTGAVW